MHSESAALDATYHLVDQGWQPTPAEILTESRRKRVVKLIFLVYWLLIFNGALRKWVLPEFQKEIYFVGDPIVLVLYWLSARYRLFRHATIFMTVTTVVAWLCVMEVLYLAAVDQSDLLITAAGLRSYFFYVPMAAVIAETFHREDLERLIRQTLLFAIPIAIISIIQSREPAEAIINHGISKDPGNQVNSLPVIGAMVRTTGTFTSNIGQAMFVGSIIAMLIWVWTLPATRRPLQGVTLLAATGAVLVNVAVSGQRMIFVLAALVLCAAFVAAMLMKEVGTSWNVIKSCAILGVVGVLLGPALFPAQLHALGKRSAGPVGNDSTYIYNLLDRALNDLVAFTESIDATPFAGYGIGEASNASSILHRSSVGWVENDWQRHVVELGPFLGIVLILLRVALVAWLCGSGCISARRHEDGLGLLLIGFIGTTVLYSSVTSQGTVTGYAWLFTGFCMAANRSREFRWER